jgi:hypothetical protein
MASTYVVGDRVHAVLGGFFLFIYGVIDGVIAMVGIGIKGIVSTGA